MVEVEFRRKKDFSFYIIINPHKLPNVAMSWYFTKTKSQVA